MALFRLLLWDMATALSGHPDATETMPILDVLRKGREECLALSDLPEEQRDECVRVLSSQPGFVGAFWLDTGNPVLLSAFYDGLMHLAYLLNGAVLQQLDEVGEETWPLAGAENFRPNGMTWIENDFGNVPPAFKFGRTPLSARGAISVDRLKRKTHTTVEGRIFQALVEASWTDKTGQTYSFSSVEPGKDILQAVLPEGKFTRYLFNKDHDKGGKGKAAFLIDELGFDPDDWRFLAAQFYDALLLAKPRDLEIRRWKDGYGAKFNVLVEVTARSGKSGVLRTGWMLEPGRLPSLATALPDHADAGVVKPPIPPVVEPRPASDEFYLELFRVANECACAAHDATLPTPVLLEDFGIFEEGELGLAFVVLARDQIGFARWLVDMKLGRRTSAREVAILCPAPSQSLERAEAYATAFARVLALNGVASRIEARAT